MMHHAYVVTGDLAHSLRYISEEDRVFGPDVLLYEYEKFGINEARKLKHESSLAPIERAYRVFIISFSRITTEAQNALLKLFEEPVGEARYYLITKSEDVLIKTLRSRLIALGATSSPHTDQTQTIAFLNLSYQERLAEITERSKHEDTTWIEQLFDGIEVFAHTTNNYTVMKEIIFVRLYEKTHGASRKMLLEHMALSLPLTT